MLLKWCYVIQRTSLMGSRNLVVSCSLEENFYAGMVKIMLMKCILLSPCLIDVPYQSKSSKIIGKILPARLLSSVTL